MKYFLLFVGFLMASVMSSCESKSPSEGDTLSQPWLEGAYFGLSRPNGSRAISMIFDKNGTVEITMRSDFIDNARIPTIYYEGTYTLSGNTINLKHEVKYKDGSSMIFENVWERKYNSGLEFLVSPELNPRYESADEINLYGIVVRGKEMNTKKFISKIK